MSKDKKEPMSNAERVEIYRARNKSKTLALTAQAVQALADYQQRHNLPNRSAALLHAIERANKS